MNNSTINSTPNPTATCQECQERLPDLLLDPASVPASVETHVAVCNVCQDELGSLIATFNLMDEWTAPEPSAYFDTRLHARLREEQAAAPEGFFDRVRSFLLFSTGRSFRPAMAGALALALAVSGGSVIGVRLINGGSTPQASATINDLKVLDNNDQALQQMDQLLDDNDDQDNPPTT